MRQSGTEDEQEGHEMQAKAEVGVFGGSGFYSFLEDVEEVTVDTPYGQPSDSYFIGDIGGTKVAFLPRHGRRHQLPPHMINYRANVWGMKELGVKRVIGPCASGSLKEEMGTRALRGLRPVRRSHVGQGGHLLRRPYRPPTCRRPTPTAPICVRRSSPPGASWASPCTSGGTVVVIQGPRFSTRAESKWFSAMGWDVINMTGYPEGYLARELELCYANISLVTDYDAGLADDPTVPPVSHHEVVSAFNANNERLRELLFAVIPRLAKDPGCDCDSALAGARG